MTNRKRPEGAIFPANARKTGQGTMPYKWGTEDEDSLVGRDIDFYDDKHGDAEELSDNQFGTEKRYSDDSRANLFNAEKWTYTEGGRAATGTNAGELGTETEGDYAASYISNRTRSVFGEYFVDNYFRNTESYLAKSASYTIIGDSVAETHTGTSNAYSYVEHDWSVSETVNKYAKSDVDLTYSESTTGKAFEISDAGTKTSISHTGSSISGSAKGYDASYSATGEESSVSAKGLGYSSSLSVVDISTKSGFFSVSNSAVFGTYSFSAGYKYSVTKETKHEFTENNMINAKKIQGIYAGTEIRLISAGEQTTPNAPDAAMLVGLAIISFAGTLVGNIPSTVVTLKTEEADMDQKNFRTSNKDMIAAVAAGLIASLVHDLMHGALAYSEIQKTLKTNGVPDENTPGGKVVVNEKGVLIQRGQMEQFTKDVDFKNEVAGNGKGGSVLITKEAILLHFNDNNWIQVNGEGVQIKGNLHIDGEVVGSMGGSFVGNVMCEEIDAGKGNINAIDTNSLQTSQGDKQIGILTEKVKYQSPDRTILDPDKTIVKLVKTDLKSEPS